MHQLSLFAEEPPPVQQAPNPTMELGTFKDSMKAPIHGWFRYPAGYSYKFVHAMFARYEIGSQAWVYDPFSGSGTTLVCAQQKGINAYGAEAHSFVHWVAEVKLTTDYRYDTLVTELEELLTQCRRYVTHQCDKIDLGGLFPELVYKCYHPDTLRQLTAIRTFIQSQVLDFNLQNLLKLALTDTLRTAAAAGTGWPYIAPKKNSGDKPAKNALLLFSEMVRRMYSDLLSVSRHNPISEIQNVLGDSRQKQQLGDEQIDLALTSPPYLNNYDYADRTRLETYFWGLASSWRDITEQYRDHLIVAATTQVVRSKYQLDTVVSEDIRSIDRHVYDSINIAVQQLSQLRQVKGGKKDYDLMVALYFNDLLAVIREVYRVLKPGGHFCLVLGDSAPYGVHIPTETLIGQLGLGLGFREIEYEEFRKRGDKWKQNPQRHTVKLREGMIVLTK